MDEFDISIVKKIYELYKVFCGYRSVISKENRYTIWQKTEGTLLDVFELILLASQLPKRERRSVLERASAKLGLLRMFLRLMKDTKAIDVKKYAASEQAVDEIGRMLGGWIKWAKE